MRIDQMLHGYDNGHRLLAGSVLLKNNTDMDTIATLSDWSEYVAMGGRDSTYITAYPLKESRYYVIAKTWYADEMKRPGCVWTHSLLIPFEVLNSIDNFLRIDSLFVRPTKEGAYDIYSHAIEYENKNYTTADYVTLDADRGLIGLIISTFLKGGDPIFFIANKNITTMETLLLSVMNVLTMTMIQNISWCSGTAYIRKVNGAPLTCQFLTRATDVINKINPAEEEQWLTYLINRLMLGDVNQGQLIRMFAADISDSSDKYEAVLKVLYTLEDYFQTKAHNEERYKTVLEIITTQFPTSSEGHVIKKLCSNKSFSNMYCTDVTFFFYFATLQLDGVFDIEETKINERWHEFIKEKREQYLPLISLICNSGSVNSWGLYLLKESVDILYSNEIEQMIKEDFHLFYSITLINSDILNRVQWLLLSSQEIESILPIILDRRMISGFKYWDIMFSLLLERGIEINESLAEAIFERTKKATIILLDYLNRGKGITVNHDLERQLSKRTKEVLLWLNGIETISDDVAYVIIHTINEKSNEVVDFGPKAWRSFLSLQYHNLRTEVYSYLFALSFNWPSKEYALELMQIAFYPLHTLEASGKLSYSNWLHIASYMEPVMFWDEWDKCKKMRKTVVMRLKSAGVDKSILSKYTPNVELNEQLERMW